MLTVDSIWKSYEGKPLLKGISFTVNSGETLCLLGPSGGGKSTLLRIIAGLESTEKGRILWDGQDLRDTAVHLRHFGLMFQDYALFPHRNVAENVAFGLRMQNQPREKIDVQVQTALERVNLRGFEKRRVTDLSGGEQQRVALARALAPEPRLLMLDEPLGALDRALREQIMTDLRQVLHQSGIPAIYVTHDQEEAFTVGDRLALLRDGQIEQIGDPQTVYQQPVSPWAARFMGMTNILTGEVVTLQPLKIRTSAGTFSADLAGDTELHQGQRGTLLLGRPVENGEELQARVEDNIFYGERYRVKLTSPDGVPLQFDIERAMPVDYQIPIRLGRGRFFVNNNG